MFASFETLSSLDLSSFDISNLTSYNEMFNGVSSNGNLEFDCSYSSYWDDIINNSSISYFPSNWTYTEC